MIPSFCKQLITRVRPSTKDSRGSIIYDWNNTSELDITECSVQPANGFIDTDGRVLGLSSTYNVYVNPDADIHAGDRIRFNGNLYDVDEEPGIWQSPTGRVSSKQFAMTLHKG